MQPNLVMKLLGMMVLLFTLALLPPIGVALYYRDGMTGYLCETALATLASGFLLWWPVRNASAQLRTRDGFIVVALVWAAASLLGALPFVLTIGLSPVDAIFESVSGFTTTGATVIMGIDALPRSVLFYRQELQWLGGIGIVVSAIALLPMLGVGGMQLMKAETPGPVKDEKLTPRIVQSTRIVWRMYLALTVICAFMYWAAGMSGFDAIAHSLSTVSTGGFSTHDASFAWFDSPAVDAVAIVFMTIGAISFGVHYAVWHTLDLGAYRRDPQVRVLITSMLVATVICTLVLWHTGAADGLLSALRKAAFTVVSVHTSTGFGVENFAEWPLLLPVLLIFISFIGGCAGSTAGGMKTIRMAILGAQASRQVHRLIHPNSVIALRLGEGIIPDEVSEAVWGFFAVYIATFAVLMLVVMAEGVDQVTAFGAIATCLNNLGPGLGAVSTHFIGMSDANTLVFSLAMLLGRLEIFTFLVLLSPDFWQR